jgi:hypothetical protein
MMANVLEGLAITPRLKIPPSLPLDDFSENIDNFARDFSSTAVKLLKSGIIKQPYTFPQHLISKRAKNLLKRGEIVSCRPTMIINALWDAVFDKAGYVNEMSIVFSILDSDKS